MARTASGRKFILDVESLRVFREVVAQGGFTAASKVLGVTQPAVSLKIRRLEERLGFRLIRRDGHSLTVTEHGRDLLAHAQFIVDAHDRAVDQMQRSELSGEVRFGCSGNVALAGLSAVASRFARTHPGVDLTIRVHESDILSRLLDGGELDMALMQLIDDGEGAVRPTDEVWRREELHIVQGIAADLTDADPVPLIAFGPHGVCYSQAKALLDAAGRAHRLALQWANVRGVQEAIEAGLGVGVLNTASVTERMRPWTGIDPIELPPTAFVLRLRDGAEENELIDALRGQLSQALVTSA